jgi:hypothetical protein
MASAARDRLGKALRGDVEPASSTDLTVRADALTLDVEGFGEELGLPNAAELDIELHSLLVYEPDQFFLKHQDTEKTDETIGTLVVTRFLRRLPARGPQAQIRVPNHPHLKPDAARRHHSPPGRRRRNHHRAGRPAS